MAVEQELQEKMMIYKTLESRMEIMNKQRELVTNKIAEILSTMSSINEIEQNSENILFKIGDELYAPGEIKDKNKVYVAIGAGVVIEKSIDEGRKVLTDRKSEMEKVLKEIQDSMTEISNTLKHIEPEINELIRMQNLTGK